MIPRIMNFYWSGKMCWMRWLTLWSFRHLNPTWEMNLYVPSVPHGKGAWKTAERDDSAYQGYDYIFRVADLNIRIKSWECPLPGLGAAQVSDLFQWWVLHTNGGWYSDMDILWVRPFNELHDKSSMYDAVFCLESGHLAIGLVGSTPLCPLFFQVYHTALCEERKNDYQSFGTDLLYYHSTLLNGRRMPRSRKGAQPGQSAIDRYRVKYPKLDIHVLPDITVYPYDWRRIPKIFHAKRPIPPDTVGMHWFGGSETVRPFVLSMAPNNWRRFSSTFTSCLEKLGVAEN